MRLAFGGRNLFSKTLSPFVLNKRPFSWVTIPIGTPETLEYRVQIQKDGKNISCWHDIPLYSSPNLLNYINEIPKGTRAKMELATDEKFSPIKQDTKKGKLRYFGYGDIPFNYGCFPQTWEDPTSPHPTTAYPGDNDPIDVVEIGPEALPTGSVSAVKVIGCLALIDEEETDWKVIALRKSHPLFDQINDISDLDQKLPTCIDAIRTWFRMYKTADGKPENSFAFDGKAMGRDFALKIIHENNQSWKDLRVGKLANPKKLVLS